MPPLTIPEACTPFTRTWPRRPPEWLAIPLATVFALATIALAPSAPPREDQTVEQRVSWEQRAAQLAPIMDRLAADQLAQLVTDRYAHEAYPRWSIDHPDRRCPASLRELDRYLNSPSGVDVWGHAMRFGCDQRTLWVHSAGADAVFGTDDDIRSAR